MNDMFRTQHQPHSRIHACLGSKHKRLYTPKYTEDGTLELVESGTENQYDYIQSYKDSVNIHVLLEQYARGDINALSKMQGTYNDYSDMPENYADMLNMVIRAENEFEKLPVEIRAKFGHSYEKWLIDMDNLPKWMENMDIIKKTDGVSDAPAAEPETVSAPAEGE